MPIPPLATLTVVGYAPARAALGAWHLAAQRPLLRGVPGLRFAKLLGTGGGIGFSARPDLATWALFAVWAAPADWARFRDNSRVLRQYRRRGREVYTLRLTPLWAHGRWDGQDLFGELPPAPPEPAAPVAVLTRATLRALRALRFWRQVPRVDRTLRRADGRLFSLGFGELPYLRQGTLSVWRSTAEMEAWAYADPAHREVIRRTRAEGWYAEELFARFRVHGKEGTWRGRDPLQGGG